MPSRENLAPTWLPLARVGADSSALRIIATGLAIASLPLGGPLAPLLRLLRLSVYQELSRHTQQPRNTQLVLTLLAEPLLRASVSDTPLYTVFDGFVSNTVILIFMGLGEHMFTDVTTATHTPLTATGRHTARMSGAILVSTEPLNAASHLALAHVTRVMTTDNTSARHWFGIGYITLESLRRGLSQPLSASVLNHLTTLFEGAMLGGTTVITAIATTELLMPNDDRLAQLRADTFNLQLVRWAQHFFTWLAPALTESALYWFIPSHIRARQPQAAQLFCNRYETLGEHCHVPIAEDVLGDTNCINTIDIITAGIGKNTCAALATRTANSHYDGFVDSIMLASVHYALERLSSQRFSADHIELLSVAVVDFVKTLLALDISVLLKLPIDLLLTQLFLKLGVHSTLASQLALAMGQASYICLLGITNPLLSYNELWLLAQAAISNYALGFACGQLLSYGASLAMTYPGTQEALSSCCEFVRDAAATVCQTAASAGKRAFSALKSFFWNTSTPASDEPETPTPDPSRRRLSRVAALNKPYKI